MGPIENPPIKGTTMNKEEALKQYFGYDEFRDGQEEIIDQIMSGRDVMCIMPTGAGKSVCYQIPAILLDGITIVVSPLISLMNDQVSTLTRSGIRAAFLNSSLTQKQYDKAILQAQDGMYKIVYVAPERLLTKSFIDFSNAITISMVTVDEAHCVSQWGHDFRPDYLSIAQYIDMLPCRPIISAFTATATREVKEDVVKILQLQNPYLITTGFNRKNLFFEVLYPQNKTEMLLRYVQKHPGLCGIVYCSTRKTVEEVCDALCKRGLPATRYHAGLEEHERTDNQNAFGCDQKKIMVATNAFGMGIDKSNVSYVVHYNMPGSIENYYQEAGRAGRDGNPAKCVMFYSFSDEKTSRYFINNSKDKANLEKKVQIAIRQKEMKRLKSMIEYSQTKTCLRAFILNYFAEKTDCFCGYCSNCRAKTSEMKKPVQIIKVPEGAYARNNFNPLNRSASHANKKKHAAKKAEKSAIGESGSFSDELLVTLYILRIKIANSERVSPSTIFPDEMLREMCQKKPCNVNDFGSILGMTVFRKNKYGKEFVDVIQDYVACHPE